MNNGHTVLTVRHSRLIMIYDATLFSSLVARLLLCLLITLELLVLEAVLDPRR